MTTPVTARQDSILDNWPDLGPEGRIKQFGNFLAQLDALTPEAREAYEKSMNQNAWDAYSNYNYLLNNWRDLNESDRNKEFDTFYDLYNSLSAERKGEHTALLDWERYTEFQNLAAKREGELYDPDFTLATVRETGNIVYDWGRTLGPQGRALYLPQFYAAYMQLPSDEAEAVFSTLSGDARRELNDYHYSTSLAASSQPQPSSGQPFVPQQGGPTPSSVYVTPTNPQPTAFTPTPPPPYSAQPTAFTPPFTYSGSTPPPPAPDPASAGGDPLQHLELAFQAWEGLDEDGRVNTFPTLFGALQQAADAGTLTQERLDQYVDNLSDVAVIHFSELLEKQTVTQNHMSTELLDARKKITDSFGQTLNTDEQIAAAQQEQQRQAAEHQTARETQAQAVLAQASAVGRRQLQAGGRMIGWGTALTGAGLVWPEPVTKPFILAAGLATTAAGGLVRVAASAKRKRAVQQATVQAAVLRNEDPETQASAARAGVEAMKKGRVTRQVGTAIFVAGTAIAVAAGGWAVPIALGLGGAVKKATGLFADWRVDNAIGRIQDNDFSTGAQRRAERVQRWGQNLGEAFDSVATPAREVTRRAQLAGVDAANAWLRDNNIPPQGQAAHQPPSATPSPAAPSRPPSFVDSWKQGWRMGSGSPTPATGVNPGR